MKRLRRIIQQSFVNPIVDFLPLLTFNLVDNFWGLQSALYVSLPISIYLSFYFFIKQPLVFHWHAFTSFVLLTIGFLVALFARTIQVDDIRVILVELIAAGTLMFVIVFKERIKKFLLKNTNTVPMDNNIEEFFRVTAILVSISFFHILAYVLYSNAIPAEETHRKYVVEYVVKCVYSLVLISFVIYETIRIFFIRKRLFKEEWWPIVNKDGKVIGSIEKAASIAAEQKYMHPVVRIAIIAGNKLLLRKRGKKDEFFSDVWDVTLSEHMRYGETIEVCAERTLNEAIEFNDVKKVEYKSSYTVLSKSDNEVMFFFVIQLPKEQEFSLAKEYGETLKWWTTQQIDDNIGLGIFAEPFIREYPYLHSKGLVGK